MCFWKPLFKATVIRPGMTFISERDLPSSPGRCLGKVWNHRIILWVFQYLQVVQWVHLHDRTDGVERQRDLDALVRHEWSVDGERAGGNHPEADAETKRCWLDSQPCKSANLPLPTQTCSCWTGQQSRSCAAEPCWWSSCPCTCGLGGERRYQRSPGPWPSLQGATPEKNKNKNSTPSQIWNYRGLRVAFVCTHCFWGYVSPGGDGHARGQLKQVIQAAAGSRGGRCGRWSKRAWNRRWDEVLTHLKQPQPKHPLNIGKHLRKSAENLQTITQEVKIMPKESVIMKTTLKHNKCI